MFERQWLFFNNWNLDSCDFAWSSYPSMTAEEKEGKPMRFLLFVRDEMALELQSLSVEAQESDADDDLICVESFKLPAWDYLTLRGAVAYLVTRHEMGNLVEALDAFDILAGWIGLL